MEEEWKDVVGFEGKYKVSSLGNIMGKKILKQMTTQRGYKRIPLQMNGKEKKFFVHRLVAEAFICPREEWQEVNHINAIKSDNRVENLEYVSRAVNQSLILQGRKRGVIKTEWGFRAGISHESKSISIGTFNTLEEAHEAYCEKFYQLKGFYPW